MCGISIYSGNAPGTPSPHAAAFAAVLTAGSLQRGPGLCQWGPLFIQCSGRWWGVMEPRQGWKGQGEISYAQTITMGSKPQNIYLFQPNGSIKWTPAMFLA
ncbi:Gm12689 [Phodopus roborovskii]|uniref:Gm12689 protein n=1 Tax=Phodopus roborovskii TaxID=109678 RepID=A0AAU9ZEY7_PHORO|nr:Gm12689 [Phodopus roborovskii]